MSAEQYFEDETESIALGIGNRCSVPLHGLINSISFKPVDYIVGARLTIGGCNVVNYSNSDIRAGTLPLPVQGLFPAKAPYTLFYIEFDLDQRYIEACTEYNTVDEEVTVLGEEVTVQTGEGDTVTGRLVTREFTGNKINMPVRPVIVSVPKLHVTRLDPQSQSVPEGTTIITPFTYNGQNFSIYYGHGGAMKYLT